MLHVVTTKHTINTLIQTGYDTTLKLLHVHFAYLKLRITFFLSAVFLSTNTVSRIGK